MEAENYKEVVDSATFCDFGRTNLVKPGPRSGMEKRTFHDLQMETIMERTDGILKIMYRLLVLRPYMELTATSSTLFPQPVKFTSGSSPASVSTVM